MTKSFGFRFISTIFIIVVLTSILPSAKAEDSEPMKQWYTNQVRKLREAKRFLDVVAYVDCRDLYHTRETSKLECVKGVFRQAADMISESTWLYPSMVETKHYLTVLGSLSYLSDPYYSLRVYYPGGSGDANISYQGITVLKSASTNQIEAVISSMEAKLLEFSLAK